MDSTEPRLQNLFEEYKEVYAETDMRAMYNPTRMQVIKEAVEKLIVRICTTCPVCGCPGYGITDSKVGLPCEICGLPTNSTLSLVYGCLKYEQTEEVLFPNNKRKESATYCNFCNP